MADYNPFAGWQPQNAGVTGGYGEGELQFTNLSGEGDAHQAAYAVNPKTGQVEPVYFVAQHTYDDLGNLQGGGNRYYFASDPDKPADAQIASNDTFSTDNGSFFDSVLGPAAVQGGLAAMTGAGALEVLGGAGGLAGTQGGTLGAIGGDLSAIDAAAGLLPNGGVLGSGGGILSSLGLSGGGGLLESLGSGGWARLAGSFLPAILGTYTSNELGNDLHDIAQQQHQDWETLRGDRLPFLNKGTKWLEHPNSYLKGPAAKGAIDATLRALSVTGNPFGSPFKMEMASNAALQSWLDAWSKAGAIGTGTPMPAAPTADIAAAQADASGYNAIGWGIGNYLNPQPTMLDYLRAAKEGVT